jgi:hypothetical protein
MIILFFFYYYLDDKEKHKLLIINLTINNNFLSNLTEVPWSKCP